MGNGFKIPFAFNGRSEGFACRSGSRLRDKMHLVFDERGRRHLEKVGETDAYQLIQSYRDSCDLHKILERCMETGDVSILQRVQGVYYDITGLPCDSRAAHDLMVKSKLVYEGLTAKQKALYPTFDDFMDVFATPENIEAFIETMKPAEPAAASSEGSVTNES